MRITKYEDSQLKITNEGDLLDDVLYIKDKAGSEKKYSFPTKIENTACSIPRGNLEKELDSVNSEIKDSLRKAGLNIDALHIALCEAYFWCIKDAMFEKESNAGYPS